MLEPRVLFLTATAGGCGAMAALALLWPRRRPGAREWLQRRGRSSPANPARPAGAVIRAAAYRPLREMVARRLEGAGRDEPPELAIAFGGLATLAAALAGAVVAAFLGGPGAGLVTGLLGVLAVPALLLHLVSAATESRRRLLLAELGPLLDLVSLELSGGAPPMLALESVLARSRSQLAAVIRAQLIGSRVAGSASFDGRLAALGDRLGMPALHSLAMILGLSRDYGSGVGQGLRALAADLRRARRRRVIEVSRGALNRVLIPAAVGVLLPFMAILLFPAVSVLARSLR